MDRRGTTIVYLLTIIILLVSSGTLLLGMLEGWPLVDSLYWCVMTLVTIGDNSRSPTQELSKIFVMFYAVIGVTTVFYCLTFIMTGIIEKNRAHFEVLEKKIPE